MPGRIAGLFQGRCPQLVPTLRVGMPSPTLRVVFFRPTLVEDDAERRRRHSHAERGNEISETLE